MDSEASKLVSILLILCILICFLEKNIVKHCNNQESPQNQENYMHYRQLDLSKINLDFAFQKSDEWGIDSSEMMAVLIAYSLPFEEENYASKKAILNKKRELLQKDPDGFEFGKTMIRMALEDVTYFPVPIIKMNSSTYWIQYINSWGFERTYGGNRIHEGTDLMAQRNEPSFYPILSVSDGIVEKKGWLEKGGYRIGIRSDNGCYFYYAHLAEYADIKEGDYVKAGQLLGFMGNTGYGVQVGTSGLFDVHLHFGIYFNYKNQEYSFNPYWVLKKLENNVLSYNYDRK